MSSSFNALRHLLCSAILFLHFFPLSSKQAMQYANWSLHIFLSQFSVTKWSNKIKTTRIATFNAANIEKWHHQECSKKRTSDRLEKFLLGHQRRQKQQITLFSGIMFHPFLVWKNSIYKYIKITNDILSLNIFKSLKDIFRNWKKPSAFRRRVFSNFSALRIYCVQSELNERSLWNTGHFQFIILLGMTTK